MRTATTRHNSWLDCTCLIRLRCHCGHSPWESPTAESTSSRCCLQEEPAALLQLVAPLRQSKGYLLLQPGASRTEQRPRSPGCLPSRGPDQVHPRDRVQDCRRASPSLAAQRQPCWARSHHKKQDPGLGTQQGGTWQALSWNSRHLPNQHSRCCWQELPVGDASKN